MATSALPLLLGVGALFLLKSKGKDAPAGTATTTTETDVGGGAAAGTGNGSGGAGTGTTATGSSGYKNVSAAMMETIQKQLIQLGYDPGAADGQWRFGGTTYKAVKKFQGDNNLEDDGKPGPITRAKLNEMTATSSDDSSEGESPPGNGGSGQSDFTEAEMKAVPALASQNEVAFNLQTDDYEIGSYWMNSTLETWLDQRRAGGWLATKSNDAWSYEESGNEHTAQYWLDKGLQAFTGAAFSAGGVVASGWTASNLAWFTPLSVPASIAVGVLGVAATAMLVAKGWMEWSDASQRRYIEETGALAMQEFIATQSVIVGPKRKLVRIKDLKRSEGITDFLAEVAERIARFQSSTYG